MRLVCILGDREAGFINTVVDGVLHMSTGAPRTGEEGEGYIDPRVGFVDCGGKPGRVIGYVFVGGVDEVVEFGV